MSSTAFEYATPHVFHNALGELGFRGSGVTQRLILGEKTLIDACGCCKAGVIAGVGEQHPLPSASLLETTAADRIAAFAEEEAAVPSAIG